MARRLWTREEFILALDLYYRTPFGQIHYRNPDIIKLANFIGRTASSVAMRLSNFANCDPELKAAGINGLSGGLDKCQPYWDEFYHQPEKLKLAVQECRKTIVESFNIHSNLFPEHITEWDNFVREITDYPFQAIARKNYNNECAITGFKITQCLVGCHIIPSSENEFESMNASNSLYLNLTYARAFIEGLIGIDNNYRIHFSDQLLLHKLEMGFHLFKRFEGAHLHLGNVVVKPEPKFFEWHMDTIFNHRI